jgi:transposase-like protein
MFVGTGTPRKPEERQAARELRETGMPIKRIAAALGVSPSSVFFWTRDIELTPEQRQRTFAAPPDLKTPNG